MFEEQMGLLERDELILNNLYNQGVIDKSGNIL
jgi:hypothetical protein